MFSSPTNLSTVHFIRYMTMGAKRVTTEEWVKRAQAVHGDRYDYSRIKVVKDKVKVPIVCKKHGEFLIDPRNHVVLGLGCYRCAGKIRTLDEWVLECREVHGDRYDYSKAVFKNMSSGVEIVCPVHGSFMQNTRVHLCGHGCSKCACDRAAQRYSDTTESFLEKAVAKWGDQFDYSQVRYVRSSQPVTIVCKEHGPWEIRPNDHLTGNGCPRCIGRVHSLTEMLDRFTAVHGDRYDYSKVEYVQGEVTVGCPDHGDFEIHPYHHWAGTGCPSCRITSRPEALLREALPACDSGNRKVLGGLELDMYWPESKLAVELNGVYWHSEARGKTAMYHLNKTMGCKAQDIQLLHFWDHEVNNKFDLVVSMVNQRLGLNKRVFARKLVVEQLTAKQAREFLDQHHIQGYANANVSYGLRSPRNGKLAMVMTFGKPRFNKAAEWELIRMASHQGLTVVGGASRLLKAFEKENNPTSLLSYADLRYSQGRVYRELGFTFQSRTPPSYFWDYGGATRYKRYQTQKHLLPKLLGPQFNPSKSEKQNMEGAGYSRVFDCGTLVYTKEYV